MAARWCSQRLSLDVFFALRGFFLHCFLFCLWPPGPPFVCLHSLPLCLMFSLCVFLSSRFIQTPSALLQSFFLSLWTLYSSIKLTPTYSFSLPAVHHFSAFCIFSVSDGSLYSAMSSVGSHAGSIRRTFGSQKLLKTENVWLLSE